MKKRKFVKLNKTQKALLYLAEMMEREDHTAYQIRNHILDILGLEFIPNKK